MYVVIAAALVGLLVGMVGDISSAMLGAFLGAVFGALIALFIGFAHNSADYQSALKTNLVALDSVRQETSVYVEGTGSPGELQYLVSYRDENGMLRFKELYREMTVIRETDDARATIECYEDRNVGLTSWSINIREPAFCKIVVPRGSIEERAQIPETEGA